MLECGELSRPGVAGLDRYPVVNIDHHTGNTGYGALNWYDPSAAACAEMVLDLVDALGVPLTREIATGVYVAILTDTGSFRHANITARTFEACRRAAAAGVDAAAVARQVFDSSAVGKLKLMSALLGGMRLEADDRLAVLYLDDEILRVNGATRDDTEGLVNLPFSAREVRAVAFFKVEGPDEVRVSLRSKGAVDVRAVAVRHGGGGHPNAAGFTMAGAYEAVRDRIVREVTEAIAAARRNDREKSPPSQAGLPGSPADLNHARSLHRRQAGRSVVARRGRAPAPRDRHQAHRPYRHARPDGHRRARAARGTGHAARALPGRRREGLRGDVPAGHGHRHLRRQRDDRCPGPTRSRPRPRPGRST